MLFSLKIYFFTIVICLTVWPAAGRAAPISVVNAGFEDTSVQAMFNEFAFGTPTDWTQHDLTGIFIGSGNRPDVLLGTLELNGTVLFNTTASEGNKVAIMLCIGDASTISKIHTPHRRLRLSCPCLWPAIAISVCCKSSRPITGWATPCIRDNA